MSNFFFIVVENESFFGDFFNSNRGRLDENIKEDFDTINDFINSSKCYENIVLLWHLSSSGIAAEELKNKIQAIDEKYKQKIIVKIGKSEDKEFLDEAEKTKWFSICDYGDNIKSKLRKCNWKIDTLINHLAYFKSKQEKTKVINCIIYLFLPLDIDMQALKDAESPKVFLQNMYEDLDALYRLKKYDSKNINHHYRQKLYDLWYLLGQDKLLTEISENASSKVRKLTPMDNPPKELLEIAGINKNKSSQVYKFFESLDTIKVDDKNLAEAVDYLCKPFDIQIEQEKITTFHEWYCALDRYLRNEAKS